MHNTYNIQQNDVPVNVLLKVIVTSYLLYYKTDRQMLQIIFKTYSK